MVQWQERKMDKRWKAVERAIAKRLNGKRVGQYGGADVTNEIFAVEVKHRKALPKWLHGDMQQAEDNAGKLIPLLVYHQSGVRHSRDYVIMRLSVFEKIC
jgi:hypothetical protein